MPQWADTTRCCLALIQFILAQCSISQYLILHANSLNKIGEGLIYQLVKRRQFANLFQVVKVRAQRFHKRFIFVIRHAML